MIKRLLCFLAVFTILSFPAAYAETGSGSADKVQEDAEMLRAFGILGSGIGSLDSTMKRGDFFDIICNMINLDNTEDLVSARILDGTDDGDFMENDDLTYEQAVTLLVRALGYRTFAESQGGYPNGYMKIANELDLLDDVSVQQDLSKSEIIKMICNACDVVVMSLTNVYDGGGIYSTENGKTLLEYYHNIHSMRGVVSAVGDICINSESSSAFDGMIIDGTYISVSGTDAEQYLGMNVDCYYRRQDGSEDRELVYIVPNNKTEVLTIQADDIVREKTTKSVITYSIDNGRKNETADISPVADMVYNRRGYINYTADDMMPEVGEVKLVDNNGDGTFDCIIVTAYKTMVVDRVSTISEEIFSKYGGDSLNLSNANGYTIKNTDGTELNLSEIQNGNVIFALIPKNNDEIQITVSQNTVTGSALYASKDDKTLTIDDTVYEINRQMYDYYETAEEDIMEVGKERTYYLDPAGRIAGYEALESSEAMYAYLYYHNLDYDGTLYITVLNENGEWQTYTMNETDRFTFNNTSVNSTDDANNMLTDRQVIKLTVDSDSKIKRIETATTIPDGEDTEYFNKITITKTYYSSNSSFNSEYYLDGNLIVFKLPTGTDAETGEEYANSKNNYSVTGNEFIDYGNYTVTLYDVDSNNRARVISYELNVGSKTLGNTAFLINKKGTVAKDGEVLPMIEGVVVGQELRLTAENETMFDGLECGDLIRFHMNDDGRVDEIGIVQKASDEWLEGEILTSSLASSTPAIMKGTVTHIDAAEGYMKISGTDGTRALKLSGTKYSIFDSGISQAKVANCADIQIGDFVVVLASSSSVRSVTIYR